MFRGIIDTTIDIKGRTSIPAKFRDALVDFFGDERFFLTMSSPVILADGALSQGLAIYPYKEWVSIEEKLLPGKGHGLNSSELDAVMRQIIAPAVECVADKLGRILVPPKLRKSANLEREIVFVGMLHKAQIWSLNEWDKLCRHDEQSLQNMPRDSRALADLGL
jgi:MraZ protein